jgi:hypothetical protein
VPQLPAPGYTFAQIAETMRVSASTTHAWYKKGLDAIIVDDALEVRRQMLDRLDYMPLMKAVGGKNGLLRYSATASRTPTSCSRNTHASASRVSSRSERTRPTGPEQARVGSRLRPPAGRKRTGTGRSSSRNQRDKKGRTGYQRGQVRVEP